MAPRFFVPLDLAPATVGKTLDLPDGVVHHATRVLRLSVGDALALFNGAGGEYAVTITRIDKRGVTVRIDRYDPVERESSLAITLAQAIASSDAMDRAVRKATELGVLAIQPLVTGRSAALPSGERSIKRVAHWRQVAIAACEQCGRNRVPDIPEPRSFADWLAEWRGSGIMLVPDARASLASLAAPSPPLALLIGPEGDWLPHEAAAASQARFATVRLGPRVMRVDTAVAVGLGAAQLLWGDLR